MGEGCAGVAARERNIGADGVGIESAVEDAFGRVEREIPTADADVELYATLASVECFAKEFAIVADETASGAGEGVGDDVAFFEDFREDFWSGVEGFVGLAGCVAHMDHQADVGVIRDSFRGRGQTHAEFGDAGGRPFWL